MPASFRIYSPIGQDHCVLRQAKPVGPPIGLYRNLPLHEAVQDELGRVYRYVGVCEQRSPSFHCPDQFATHLGDGEFILPPGVVYRMDRQ